MANCCVILSAIVVSLAAIFLGLYYNQLVPEGLPDDQLWSARMCGTGKQILSSLVILINYCTGLDRATKDCLLIRL